MCSGGVAEPNITVTRTQTLTSDASSGDSISFDIAQDYNWRDIHYLLISQIKSWAYQYYLVSCSDGLSVLNERIAFQTVDTLQSNNIQPYFESIEPLYIVVVDLAGCDVEVFKAEAVVSAA